MKITLKIAIFTLLGLVAAGCGKYEKVSGDPMKARIYTLDNGLKVYMTVNKEQPRIQTYIAVRTGGKTDPHESTGLAHYLEHLMFKGTQQYGTQDYAAEKPLLDQIDALYEEYGKMTDPAERKAQYHKIDSVSFLASQIAIPNEYDKMMSMIGARGTNAWTSEDETVYTEDIPSNQIENWAKIQADRFMNLVPRGFHTELEAVYEEYNMNLTSDMNKVFEKLMTALFPHHPYGMQTVIGTQEHLKNPSLKNIKAQYDKYYRPNNSAICLSGDFDPDQAIKIIKKYFGSWEPRTDIPKLQYEPEKPITAPVTVEVKGQEAEMVAMGWSLPAAKDVQTAAVADIAGSILFNGSAGLMDLDVNQQQKCMFLQAASYQMADYGMMLAMGMPKQGQTLDEVRDLALAELAKLRNGDFDESLIAATVNNIKLQKMRQLESNGMRARLFVQAFINGIDWKDAALDIQRYSTVTKEDVVKFANEYLGDNNFAIIYKRQGIDDSEKKIEAPAITPIATNRDKQSEFLKEIASSKATPIEPVFADFSKDLSISEFSKNVELRYKKNEINDIATVQYIFNRGTEDIPALGIATDYLGYLGTPEMSAEDIARKMYELACNFGFYSDAHHFTVNISGLGENIPEAASLVENLILNAVPEDAILDNLKGDVFKNRQDRKADFDACFSALRNYLLYGPEYVKKTTLGNDAIAALTSEDLLKCVKDLYGKGHIVTYYGPAEKSKAVSGLKTAHKVSDNPEPLEERFTPTLPSGESDVLLANYDSKQFSYFQYTSDGTTFDTSLMADINMYNEYFGGGMNSIVFQEMRESKALAYSSSARYVSPSSLAEPYYFYAYIGSQNDKLRKAVNGFDEIINDMPEVQNNFDIAKEGLLSRMRTQRTTGMRVFSAYEAARLLGLSEPVDKQIYAELQGKTLADVLAFQQKNVKDRKYDYAICGNAKDLDMDFLKTLGKVKILSLEEIFGY